MSGIGKLEEKLAETTDPILRKQFQELLEKRKKEQKQMVWGICLIVLLVYAIYTAHSMINTYNKSKDRMMEIEHESKLLNMSHP